MRSTSINTQKVDGTTIETYVMVVALFSVTDQADKVKFFEETFLVVNVSPNMVFGMPFLTLSIADVDFPKKELWWKFYTIEEAFPIIKRVELVGKKEFVAAAFNPGYEIFIIYVAFLKSLSNTQKGDVYPFCRVQIAALMANEALISISTKYSDFANIFSPEVTSKLLKYTGINDYAIKLDDNWQPPYGPIYSLGPEELETVKTSIKTNLANGFIRPSKSLIWAPILFNKKSNRNLQLYVDY